MLEQTVFLQPAELFTATRPARVKTVVGSCLAITMRAGRLGLAAMAHSVLPRAGLPARQLPPRTALRYVDTTIELMLSLFRGYGATLVDIEIKIFGGADGLSRALADSGLAVGNRNIQSAETALHAHSLTAAVSGVGGTRGRVIEFDTLTGDVFVKPLPTSFSKTRGESL